jgi:hypothetical protein
VVCTLYLEEAWSAHSASTSAVLARLEGVIENLKKARVASYIVLVVSSSVQVGK